MTDSFIQIVFGWPVIIVAILLSIAGLFWKKPILLALAGILCIPFIYYVIGGFRSPALILPLFQLGAAYAVKRHKTLAGWLLVAPLIIVSLVLAYTLLTK